MPRPFVPCVLFFNHSPKHHSGIFKFNGPTGNNLNHVVNVDLHIIIVIKLNATCLNRRRWENHRTIKVPTLVIRAAFSTSKPVYWVSCFVDLVLRTSSWNNAFPFCFTRRLFRGCLVRVFSVSLNIRFCARLDGRTSGFLSDHFCNLLDDVTVCG